MMFELFAVEAAVAEKFFLEESAVAFADMRPNADGTLSAFCIEQLVDVVRALQRCLDHETILNAWSHSLDHSPPTCAHVFQMKTVLAQLHGSGLDYHTFVGTLDPNGLSGPGVGANRASASGAAQGRPAPPTNLDDLDDDELEAVAARVEADAATAAQGEEQEPPPDMHGTGENDPVVPPTAASGAPVCTALQTKSMMQNGMTRRDCGKLAETLELQRQMRAEYSRRLEKRGVREARVSSVTAHEQLTEVFVDGVDSKKVGMHKLPSTGKVVEAARAAACMMPTAQDALAGGISDQFLKDMLEGQGSNACGGDLKMLGIMDERGDYRKAWDYECTSNKTGSRGPADYDFNWAMLSAFTRSKKGDEDGGGEAVGAKRKKSTWTNVARQIKQCVRTGGDRHRTFSLMDIESMTFESMRDTLFLIAQPLNENKVRVAKHNFSQTQLMKKQSRLLHENEEFGEADLPEKVHPQGMFSPTKTADGTWQYDPGFSNPEGVQRLSDGNAQPSDYQKRLDHFTDRRALASCVAPVAFERDLPIKESEAHNAIYFNKWIANEHAALVVEAGAYLARVPGVAGGDYTKVPSSFRRQSALKRGRDGKLPTMERQENARHAHMQDDDGDEDANEAEREAFGRDATDPDPSNVAQDSMEPERGSEEEQRAYEEEQAALDEEEEYANAPLASEEVDEQAVGMEPLEKDVSEPGSEGSGLNARPGVAAASVALSVDENADVPAMPYDWDMLQMFLTFKMIDTLHNDSQDYVARMAEFFPDVYGSEDKEDTLRDLPQICTRFPGLKHKNENSNYLFPLTRPVPLVASRVCDLESSVNSKRAPRELAEAALSIAMGRRIRYDDPEVADHEAESRGVDGAAMLTGNLFSRSAWLNFTLRAMDARGMAMEDEIDRAQDQGLYMMMRVRNVRAVAGHPDRFKTLQSDHELRPESFTAQERRKRLRLDDGSNEDSGEPAPSAAQSARAQAQAWQTGAFQERMKLHAAKKPRNA